MNSTFEVSNAQVWPGSESIDLTFDVHTDDPTLKSLLAEGEARVSLRWRCSATLATEEDEPRQRMALADGHQYEYWIDQRQVRGDVDADVRVLAIKPLIGFRWERQNPEYGDAVFDIGVGDVLADGGSIPFKADKLYDPLDPPVGSCFRFMEDLRLRKGMRVTFEEDEAILVRLSPEVHRNLRLLAARPELQISTVVLPALMQAVTFIQQNRQRDDGEDLTGRPWYKAISDKVDRLNRSLEEDAIDIAQKILDFPVDQILSLEVEGDDE